MTTKWERLQRLVNMWLNHVRETPGHSPPAVEGGEATYTTSPSAYRVYCCMPGCLWQDSVNEE